MRELNEKEFRLRLEFEDGFTRENVIIEKTTNDDCCDTQYDSILNTITEFIRRMGFYVPEESIFVPISEFEYDEIRDNRYEKIVNGTIE